MKCARKATPVNRLGWHKFYAAQFNRTGRDTSAMLAMAYLFLHLAFDVKEEP